jgi:hypothetical protein
MTTPRLATGLWVAAKMRQIQISGNYASILVKGHDVAGTVTLVLRLRDGTLKLARPAIGLNDADTDRVFEWRQETMDEQSLNAHIKTELRFDRDQWFVEIECRENEFSEIFNIKSV